MKNKISKATMTEKIVNMEIIPSEEDVVFKWDGKKVIVYLDDGGICSIDYNSNDDLNQILEIMEISPSVRKMLEDFGIYIDDLTDWVE